MVALQKMFADAGIYLRFVDFNRSNTLQTHSCRLPLACLAAISQLTAIYSLLPRIGPRAVLSQATFEKQGLRKSDVANAKAWWFW